METPTIASLAGEDVVRLWHHRLGHYPVEKLKAAYSRGLVRGFPVPRAELMKKAGRHRCSTCDLTKATRVHHWRQVPDPFVSNIVALGDCIVCDSHLFWAIPSRDGTRMMLNLTDVATRIVWSFRMQQKSDSLKILQKFHAAVVAG